MQAFERIIILAVFGAHISFVFYHFLADYDPIIPLVNDQLLHQIQVRRISQIFLQQRIGSESSWSKWLSPSSWSDWLPLQSVDHVLGSHGLGFPFVMHYQHFPHIIVGALGAFLRDPDLAFAISTAVGVGLLLPLAVFTSLVGILGVHPLSAVLSLAVIPAINDAPPAAQMQQGFQYNYGLGWGAFMHGGHGLWTQIYAAAALFPAFALACRALSPHAMKTRGHRMKFAVAAGLFVGLCGLCNVLYGYMAGCMVSAVAVMSALDSLVFKGRTYAPKRLEEAVLSKPDFFLATGKESTSESQDAPERFTAFLRAFVILVVITTVAILVSAYFLVPHLLVAKGGVISNYEARDYKITGEGLPAAVRVLFSGNLLDYGWTFGSSLFEGEHLSKSPQAEILESVSQFIAHVPKLPFLSILTLVGWFTVILSIANKSGDNDSADQCCSKDSASFLAARAAALLILAFLILYGGYGSIAESHGVDSVASDNQAASSRRRRVMSPEAAAAATAKAAKIVASLADGKAQSDSWNPRPVVDKIMIIFRWLSLLGQWLWKYCIVRFLSFAVEHLPMIKVLHLHRFLGGVHAMSLFLVPCAVEAFAHILDAVLRALSVPLRAALNRFNFLSIANSASSNPHNVKRGSSRSRGIVVLFCFVLLSPAYERRCRWLLEVEAPQRRKRLRIAQSSSRYISVLMERLRSLPPGRVWAGGRDSAFAFQNNTSVREAPISDLEEGHLSEADDLLFVHLQQRATRVGDSPANSLDVVGPLLHGLSKAADLIPDIDILRSPNQRRLLGVSYVALPRKWMIPYGKAVHPKGMVELSVDVTCGAISTEHVHQPKNESFCGVEDFQGTFPYRLFADEIIVKGPHTHYSSYFSVGRVLAAPFASEFLLRPTDMHQLSITTAPKLRPITAEEATHRALQPNNGLESPASAAVVHRLALGWLSGLDNGDEENNADIHPYFAHYFANESECIKEAASAATCASGGGQGRHFLAWPPRSSFEIPVEGNHNDAKRRFPEKWGRIKPETFAFVSKESVSSDLSTFQCDVLVLPSPAATGSTTPSEAPPNLQPLQRVPDASLILGVSYHPGWRCDVSILRSISNGSPGLHNATSLEVGEVIPGFPFVDLYAVRDPEGTNEGERGSRPWATQRVVCTYKASRLKGILLLLALSTVASTGVYLLYV